MTGPWYTIEGKTVKGPFTNYENAKQALHLAQENHNDEIVIPRQVYRYDSRFIGTAQGLADAKIAYVGDMKQKAPNKATHYRVEQAIEVGGIKRTVALGEWVIIK